MSHNLEVLDLRNKLLFRVIFYVPVLQCGLVFRGKGYSPVILSMVNNINIMFIKTHHSSHETP